MSCFLKSFVQNERLLYLNYEPDRFFHRDPKCDLLTRYLLNFFYSRGLDSQKTVLIENKETEKTTIVDYKCKVVR
jgi:hypothetical protein